MDYQLFKVGSVWHYRFQINGKREQRSTGETSKRRAAARADRAYTRARLWAHGEEPVPVLRELVVDWLKIHQPTASAAHLKNIETFGRLHLYDLADCPIDEISTDMVEQARIEHLRTHAPASANHWLKMLKTVCNWAIRRRVIPALPWSVKLLKVQKRPRTVLPVKSATAWLAQIDLEDGHRPGVSTAVRLMLGIGLRESEAISARWEWIDWERATYTPGVTKGREALPLPLPRWLMAYLAERRKPAGLIITRIDKRPLAAGATRKAMLLANEACGVEGLTPHRLRGTFATLLSEEGVPVQTIQRLLRHKDVRTTMAYLEENLELAAQAQLRIARNAGLDREDVSPL